MQITSIAKKDQENTIFMYWQLLKEAEHGAGDNILAKDLVEAGYRHWNTMTGDDKKPFWKKD